MHLLWGPFSCAGSSWKRPEVSPGVSLSCWTAPSAGPSCSKQQGIDSRSYSITRLVHLWAGDQGIRQACALLWAEASSH